MGNIGLSVLKFGKHVGILTSYSLATLHSMGHDVTLTRIPADGAFPVECAAKFNIHAFVSWFVLIERGWADFSRCHQMSALSRCLETMLERDSISIKIK